MLPHRNSFVRELRVYKQQSIHSVKGQSKKHGKSDLPSEQIADNRSTITWQGQPMGSTQAVYHWSCLVGDWLWRSDRGIHDGHFASRSLAVRPAKHCHSTTSASLAMGPGLPGFY